jgi:hypothetical protein
MNLDILKERDQKTVTGILAAAALASAANVAGEEPAIVKTYKTEAAELLAEVRKHLHIAQEDYSSDATISISNYLSKQLQQNILGNVDTSKILARAGRAGRLPPIMYAVEQPKTFANIFYTLGVRPNHVEDAVKHPDDYQHLMTDKASEEDKDLISLFMKEIKSAKKGNNHWLLVQCFRKGLTQIVQSAWRIFPDSINLAGAYEPVHVLKAFVAAFGLPVKVGNQEALFIESVPYPKGEKLNWTFQGNNKDAFASISFMQTNNPQILEVGIGYSIDMPKYRAYLAKHAGD